MGDLADMEIVAGQKHGERKVVGAREHHPAKTLSALGVAAWRHKREWLHKKDAIWSKLDDWILDSLLKINWF